MRQKHYSPGLARHYSPARHSLIVTHANNARAHTHVACLCRCHPPSLLCSRMPGLQPSPLCSPAPASAAVLVLAVGLYCRRLFSSLSIPCRSPATWHPFNAHAKVRFCVNIDARGLSLMISIHNPNVLRGCSFPRKAKLLRAFETRIRASAASCHLISPFFQRITETWTSCVTSLRHFLANAGVF